ncbi:hypothetical protein BC629DRAFT_926571 [Irpex lacteus]|nr:hypothetical protein BC629DRAFT_926571 [Irpex lacteus]
MTWQARQRNSLGRRPCSSTLRVLVYSLRKPARRRRREREGQSRSRSTVTWKLSSAAWINYLLPHHTAEHCILTYDGYLSSLWTPRRKQSVRSSLLHVNIRHSLTRVWNPGPATNLARMRCFKFRSVTVVRRSEYYNTNNLAKDDEFVFHSRYCKSTTLTPLGESILVCIARKQTS